MYTYQCSLPSHPESFLSICTAVDLSLLVNHDHQHNHQESEKPSHEDAQEAHGHHSHEHHHHNSVESADGEAQKSQGQDSHSHHHHHATESAGEEGKKIEEGNHHNHHHHHHHDDPSSRHIADVKTGEITEETHNHHHHHHQHAESSGEDDGHNHSHLHGLNEDALAQMDGKDFAHLIEDMDGYLCELATAQIRDGLHILGKVPEDDTMVDMLQALTRLNNLDIPSLRESIVEIFGLDAAELLSNQGARLGSQPPSMLSQLADRPLATAGDVIETVDELSKHTLALLASANFDTTEIPRAIAETFPGLSDDAETSKVSTALNFVCETIVPSLRDTTLEISSLLSALNGEFVPAGPSGSPTRGMAHLLPTGRNFYACDPQALPSFAAWEVGQGLAKETLSRFLTETGSYPEHVAISVWGTAAMRTHGDDIAQIFAFLGVRPTWQRENHRVTGVELIPLEELGRPRIDVTIRISGFFRDAFPHLIPLLDDAVNLAINADEPPEKNYIRKHFMEDLANDYDEGKARWRVFGCPPGAYGIGLLDLIEAQNWKDESDFATTYINWGGYAYSRDDIEGVDARTEFTHRLSSVEVAIHNQDDREHDIFDSDDYFQFHGGMIATIKALGKKDVKGYFGDSSNPAAPKVRDIREESLRVYRTRVVNPKWLESIKQHGYKGASEMAATVDYLFGYDATANVMKDFMYEGVAQKYALDKSTQEFYEECNPWALKGVSERLLEAAQRGMWEEPNPETLEALKQTLLQTDSMLEGRSEQP